MRRTKNKPDLLIVLAIFVGLGVLISTYSQGDKANAGAETVTADTKSSISTLQTDKNVYNSDYIKVTNQKENSQLPKEQSR